MLPQIPAMRIIQNGKEDFSVSEPKGGASAYEVYVNSAYNSAYNFSDQRLLSRYLLTTKASELKGIPVIITAQEAAALFGENAGSS